MKRLPHHHPPLGSKLKQLTSSHIEGLELLAKKVNAKREQLRKHGIGGLEGDATAEDMFHHQIEWMGWLNEMEGGEKL